jgi:hypothetical protein
MAFVFGSVFISFETLRAGVKSVEAGSCPLVLENLKRVFLVVSSDRSPADMIGCHRMIWNWVMRLSPCGDQHDLVFVFVLPPDAPAGYEGDLAVGLGIQNVAPKTFGMAFWRASGTLRELLNVVSEIQPIDLPLLRAKQKTDACRATLTQLLTAVQGDEQAAVWRCAQDVLSVFTGLEYQLDLFCKMPSHQNGNRLRKWLHESVTETVTQNWWNERHDLGDWLNLREEGNEL